MQYAVPQFVEIEDKVIGPLSVKQFAYVLGGGLFLVAMSSIVDTALLIFLAVIVAAIVVPLAFLKINGRPLPKVVVSLSTFFTKPQVRLWAKDLSTKHIAISDLAQRVEPKREGPRIKALDRSRLAELSLQLDTAGTNTYAETEPESINF